MTELLTRTAAAAELQVPERFLTGLRPTRGDRYDVEAVRQYLRSRGLRQMGDHWVMTSAAGWIER